MADVSDSSSLPPSVHASSFEERLAAGTAHLSNWWIEGEPVLLDRAVVEYRAALKQSSVEGSDEGIRAQIGLSDALRLQFEEGLGETEDEEETFREALELAESSVTQTAPPSPLHMEALRVLGEVLYRWFHSKEHLHRAVDTFRGLVDLLSDSTSDLLINALALHALSLVNHFLNEPGDQKSLIDSKAPVDRGLALLSAGQDPPPILADAHRLVCIYYRLTNQDGSNTDEDAIDEPRKILASLIDRLPAKHPRLHYYWNALGGALEFRYKLLGYAQDLDFSIMTRDQARMRIRRSHPTWTTVEGNYASSLGYRFLARGDLNDLQEAIEVTRGIVRHVLCTPARRYLGGIWVNNLVEFLTMKYSYTGDLELLDEAIGLSWDKLNPTPPARRGGSLYAQALAYRSRFLAQGRIDDLKEAHLALNEASQCPQDLTNNMDWVYALSSVLLSMYDDDCQDVTSLEKAISLLSTSLMSDKSEVLSPQKRGQYESLLGVALLRRAAVVTSREDIQESMRCQTRALELLREEDPDQHLCYFRLGLAEFQSFLRGRERAGLHNSIAAFNRALSIMPIDHPDRASYLSRLSESLLTLSDLEGSPTAMAEALARLREAATHLTSWPADRYEAAIQWAHVSHQSSDHTQAITAYQIAISLLPELASVRLEDELRVQHIGKQAREVPQDAAACALELGEPEMAIELLEAGRTLLWNARQELRADLATLGEVAPALAKELAQTNAALEFRPLNDSTTASVAEREADRRRLHRLAARRTELISQIRSYPGFEQFLLPPPFSSLRHAAANGPIIVLNASTYRCDAIVLRPDKTVAVIPLDNIKLDQVRTEAMTLQHRLAEESRDPKGQQFLEVVLQELLQWLWKSVGVPVIVSLQDYLDTPELRRVWWCPTGAFSFLPIHACSPFDRTQLGMPDIVISSYTPTISALLRAEKKKPAAELASRSMLVVSQPNAPGQSPLPGALDEMKILEDLFPETGTFLAGPAATLSTVEASLRNNGWFHVITHGSQNMVNPLESSVELYDGPLKLSRLSQAHLPHAEFAFLSACHSAKGTSWVPDESMHLAAGMIFAGFRGVVATSWAIADIDAPEITREFYTYLKQKSSPPQATDTAEALHMAVRALRKSGVSAARWVPFIHLGA